MRCRQNALVELVETHVRFSRNPRVDLTRVFSTIGIKEVPPVRAGLKCDWLKLKSTRRLFATRVELCVSIGVGFLAVGGEAGHYDGVADGLLVGFLCVVGDFHGLRFHVERGGLNAAKRIDSGFDFWFAVVAGGTVVAVDGRFNHDFFELAVGGGLRKNRCGKQNETGG